MFAFALLESQYIGAKHKNFWCIKLIGILFGIVLIPILYYTINGIFGSTPDWVNITIFFVAVAAGYLIEVWSFRQKNLMCKSPGVNLAILWLIAVVFFVFTFITPKVPLFEDPITGTYGI